MTMRRSYSVQIFEIRVALDDPTYVRSSAIGLVNIVHETANSQGSECEFPSGCYSSGGLGNA